MTAGRNARACNWAIALALAAILASCGGGGSADPVLSEIPPNLRMEEPPPPAAPAPAFEELWEPRTAATGVYGVVTTHVLQPTVDTSDPQQAWAANAITGKWGTLRDLDGAVPGLPNVTGQGPNESWHVDGGRLHFRAAPAQAPTGQTTGGYALISRQSFPRDRRVTVEAEVSMTAGSDTAFAGLALIAGEGDYRELALYRRAGVPDAVHLVAPLWGHQVAPMRAGVNVLRIEWNPAGGAEAFRYLVNGQLVAIEAADHLAAGFAADPNVGLYFTGNSAVPNAFVQGHVGPVRVWVD